MSYLREPNLVRARGAALQLLENFGVSRTEDIAVADFATSRGALVIEAPLEGCEARLVRGKTRGVIRVRKDIKESGRKRFAIAHELGHFLLHADVSQYFICMAEDLRDYRRSAVEVEANCFASQLLMPTPLFRPKCRKRDANLETVRTLAREFDTSLTATAIRFAEESGQPCMVVMSRAGVVEWTKATERRDAPRIESGQRLNGESLAYHCTDDRPSTDWAEVPAAAWFNDSDDAARWEVMEQSHRFRGYGVVLTMLSLVEKEEESEDSYDRFERWKNRGQE
jgi:Zn-dependent peptidase ImmA (M78 family)